MAAQLEITLTKADSEQLARSIAEEQYSDLEKEKIMFLAGKTEFYKISTQFIGLLYNQ